MSYLSRQTYWTNDRADIVQVAWAWLAPDWEVMGEAVEQVGPFEEPLEALRRCRRAAEVLRDRQMAGQESLGF